MTEREFKDRTKKLALRVIAMASALPKTLAANVIAKQVLRSGTSVGANYRAACQGKSAADVLAKLALVEEEADETAYWIELLVDARMISAPRVADLLREVDEIVAMTVASIKTLRARTQKRGV